MSRDGEPRGRIHSKSGADPLVAVIDFNLIGWSIGGCDANTYIFPDEGCQRGMPVDSVFVLNANFQNLMFLYLFQEPIKLTIISAFCPAVCHPVVKGSFARLAVHLMMILLNKGFKLGFQFCQSVLCLRVRVPLNGIGADIPRQGCP